MQQRHVLYDFATALSRLQDRIQTLSADRQAAAVPSTRLGRSWAFIKHNRGNVLLLLTFYSMSTASVVGGIMAEHRLQSDRLLEGKEMEQLQHHIHKLEHQVHQQQQLLDSIAAGIQQQQRSSNGGWMGAAALRQQLLAQLQQWRDGQVEGMPAGGGYASSSSSSSASNNSSSSRGAAASSTSKQQQQQHQTEEFGVRVGPLGRGFLI